MVIVGPKRVRRTEAAAKEDAEEEEYKTGCFNLQKIKAATEIFSIKKNKHRTMQNYEVQFTEILNSSAAAIDASVVVEVFNIRSILDATDHFKTKIGEGGFGSVHKGVLRNGKVIAVKRLSASSSGQGREEFLNEACVLHRKGDLLEMIEADLFMDISLKEASMMLDLAMRCTNPSPKVRPTMSEVVSILEGKSTVRTPPFHEDSALINFVPNKRMTMTMTVSTNYSSSNSIPVERNLIHKSNIPPHLFADSNDVCDLDDTGVEVVSYPLESRMEGNDIQIPFEGDSDTRKDDDKLLIQEQVMMSPEPSTSSNTPICVDATRMEDKRKLEYVETSFEEGKFHIKCSDEEFEAGYNKWKDSAVGFFVDEEPVPLNVEKKTVENLWELQGDVSIFSMENGYFLFQFSCTEDKIMVLESSPWHIHERPLVLREWDWKLKLDNTEMITLPIWVKIYNLPLFLWSSSFLSKIGSCLGVPLYSDRRTDNQQRLSFAKLCIEINARKELPDSLDISVKGVDYKLRLKYDWKPLRCATCCTFGHTEAKCGLKMKNLEQN